MAFRKAEGLGRDGVAGPATLAALDAAARPQPRTDLVDGIEIDLGRQLLLVVADGDVRWALSTSTGARSTPRGRAGSSWCGPSTASATHRSAPSTARCTSTAASPCTGRRRCRAARPPTAAPG
jgi:hypothetical protein